MEIVGRHYLMDESEYVYCRESQKKDTLKSALVEAFRRNCGADDFKRAFCQIDKDSTGKDSEGVTVYGVETKTQNMLTISIYENNYGACKEEMMVLGEAVKRANSKKSRKNQIKLRVAGVTLAVVGSIAALGSCSLKKENKYTNEAPAEVTTEVTEESLNNHSIEELPVEQQQQLIEEAQEKHNQEIMNYADENRKDLYRYLEEETNKYYEEQGIENPALTK